MKPKTISIYTALQLMDKGFNKFFHNEMKDKGTLELLKKAESPTSVILGIHAYYMKTVIGYPLEMYIEDLKEDYGILYETTNNSK